MRDVPIRDEVIRLGQLLKHSGLVDSGAEAKHVLAEGLVTVNGEPEVRRGRQLRAGDVVVLDGADDPVRVTACPA
ncbi:MAG: RNA-binding protein [Solirubrobacterales bacterium]|nr:RNA-binding protein [Solirubrobacterales bacterium]